jgi:hypothetical protein
MPLMFGDDPQVERWRNVAVGLIAAFTVGAFLGTTLTARAATSGTTEPVTREAVGPSVELALCIANLDRRQQAVDSIDVWLHELIAERMADAGVGP